MNFNDPTEYCVPTLDCYFLYITNMNSIHSAIKKGSYSIARIFIRLYSNLYFMSPCFLSSPALLGGQLFSQHPLKETLSVH
jgi:hypothetical protein